MGTPMKPSPQNPHPLIERLRVERVMRRMSVSEVATKLGYSRTYAYAIEQGTKSPSLSYLLDLSEIFGLELKLCPELSIPTK